MRTGRALTVSRGGGEYDVITPPKNAPPEEIPPPKKSPLKNPPRKNTPPMCKNITLAKTSFQDKNAFQ